MIWRSIHRLSRPRQSMPSSSKSTILVSLSTPDLYSLATFMHQIFVLSPEGQYLLKLLENVNNMIPYKMVKQSLRYGNAATMIGAISRLLLAKLSVTSVTNWFGLTANADDGMNLIQRIISLVLAWDAGEFRKSADKVEKAKEKERPSDEILQAIRQYIAQGRDEHETVQKASEQHAQSIITAILNASNPELTTSLTEKKHAQCLEYYSALLSVRDRDSITTAFCRQPPDLFTAAMKDLIAAYEPLIRTVHAGVDLREHVESGQIFIEDFIKTGKPKKADGTSTPMRSMLGGGGEAKVGRLASVDDYVELLMKHRSVMYRWIHSVASKCPDVWEDLRLWAKEVMPRFQQEWSEESVEEELGKEQQDDTKDKENENPNSEVNPNSEAKLNSETKPRKAKLSVMDKRLNELFQCLPQSAQNPVRKSLDAHSQYLTSLSTLSMERLQRIIDSDSTMVGPGIYLSRWQALLDQTPITPSLPHGPVRHGNEVKHTTTMGKIGVPGAAKAREAAVLELDAVEAPDVEVVIKEMGDGFRQLVRELGSN